MLNLRVKPVGADQANCYLVVDENAKVGILVDSGAEGIALIEWIDDVSIQTILVTHAHPDHVGALEYVRRELGVDAGTIIASHSNPHSRVPSYVPLERNLSDVTIREIASRGGVIGTVLYNPFLKDGWTPSSGQERVSLTDVAASMDYVCQILGNADHVGIGSDFDGGFGLADAPQDLDSVADLRLIGNELARLGYSESDIHAILCENWLRILRLGLPGV